MTTPFPAPTPRPPVPGPPVPRPPGARPQVPADESVEPFDAAGRDDDEATPPQTGQPAVDRALEGVVGLGSIPLADHPDRLAQAHEALHAQLQDEPRDGSRG